MILVRDIKIINTGDKRKYHPIVHYKYSPALMGFYDDAEQSCEVTREMIEGRRFRNFYGNDVVIGWDEATQIALGLPFRAFDAQERRRQSDYEENTRLRKRLREYEELNLWKLILNRCRRRIKDD